MQLYSPLYLYQYYIHIIIYYSPLAGRGWGEKELKDFSYAGISNGLKIV